MSASTDAIKARVRALLNLAENDAATEGEIDNAVRFARRLMDAHHLSEDDCKNDPHAKAADEERGEMAQEYAMGTGRHVCSWENRLCQFVSKLVGSVDAYICDGQAPLRTAAGALVFDDDGKQIMRGQVCFYGLKDEAKLATEIYADLVSTIAAMARLKFGGALRGSGREYGDGFISGLYSKLSDAKKADEISSAGSRALVVRSAEIALRKKEDARHWLKKDRGIKLRSARSSYSTFSDEHAYAAGKEDGRRANVAVNRQKRIRADA